MPTEDRSAVMPDAKLHRRCFGHYLVDLQTKELWEDKARVPLQGQPIEVLCVLVESPGELVTRETLRRKIWCDDRFVNFETGLNTAVRRLRAALGDSASAPRYIETLPKRGYRFLANVELEIETMTEEAGREEPAVLCDECTTGAGGTDAPLKEGPLP